MVTADLLAMPRCEHPSGLERWLHTALAPCHVRVPADTLLSVALVDLVTDVPILEDPQGASCVWAGRLGSIAAWEANDGSGALVARVATAPKHGLLVPRTIVDSHPYAYHQSAIGSGAAFNGYILGDKLVGVLNIEYGRRLLFLVAEFAGAGVEDYSGYWDGEAILRRLSFR